MIFHFLSRYAIDITLELAVEEMKEVLEVLVFNRFSANLNIIRLNQLIADNIRVQHTILYLLNLSIHLFHLSFVLRQHIHGIGYTLLILTLFTSLFQMLQPSDHDLLEFNLKGSYFKIVIHIEFPI